MVTRRYCSVPQCKNYASKDISLHYFPTTPNLRKKWQIALKIGKKISKYMAVCSRHFNDSDFHSNPLNIKKRYLKKGVCPSQNLPIRSIERKLPAKRKERNVSRNCLSTATDSVLTTETQEEEKTDSAHSHEVTVSLHNEEERIHSSHNLNLLAEICAKQLNVASRNVEIQCNIIDHNKKPIESILQHSDETFKIYTGIHINLFNTFVSCVENLLEDNNHLNISDVPTKILICLIKLKLNLPFTVMSGLFLLHRSTLKKSFEIMLPILKSAIEDAIYWPSFEENRKNMPSCFDKYSNTRVVLDCTEIAVQAPSCLKCRTRTYSYYKSKHTFKYLIGITPAGTISYVSPGYGGRTTDKTIFNDSGIITKLESYVDAVMVDKGFHIDKETMEAGIKLIRPPFLRSSSQLTKNQAEITADIARARIHVERSIQRIKMFKILSEKIPWTMTPYIDDAIIIIASITNLSNPIFKIDSSNL